MAPFRHGNSFKSNDSAPVSEKAKTIVKNNFITHPAGHTMTPEVTSSGHSNSDRIKGRNQVNLIRHNFCIFRQILCLYV